MGAVMPIRPQSSTPVQPFRAYAAGSDAPALSAPMQTTVACQRLRGEIAGGALGGAPVRRLVALVTLLDDLEAGA